MNFFTLFLMIACGFGAGYLARASGVLRRRRLAGRQDDAWLIIYTQHGARSLQVKEVELGLEAIDKTVYPTGLVSPVVPFGQVQQLLVGKHHIWLLVVDGVALAEHEALEKARETIALKHLFTGGGDLKGMLEVAALVAPLVFTGFVWMTMGGLQAQIAQVLAELAKMQGTRLP